MLWAGLLVLLLSACSTNVSPVPASSDFSHVGSVEIASDASRAEIERAYGGEAIVFRPEAGLAILGFHSEPGRLASMSVDANSDAFTAPEVSAGGVSAWAGGVSAWAGGFSAWAGGVSAWAGGEPTTFVENLGLWDQIDLPEAQQLAPNLGAGVKVAVIDTGIDLTHPGFEGRLAPASEWYDFVDDDAYPMDEAGGEAYGHGTGVAGIIVQVAPHATILPIRVLGPSGGGTVADVIAGIDHAVAMGADVINVSLGAVTDIKTLKDMTNTAIKDGVYLVASSGNTGDDKVTYPARHSMSGSTEGGNIGVGSVDPTDRVSDFSTRNTGVEIVAPGESVMTLVPEERYGSWTGTSFAAPMVSGTLALALGESYAAGYDGKLAEELVKAATDIAALNPGIKLGEGRLDADAFLANLIY